MFEVGEPRLVHEIPYRSSGADLPRDRRLPVLVVEYACDWEEAPTFLATADLQGRERGDDNRLLGERVADEIIGLQQAEVLPPLDFSLLCGDFYDYPDLRKLGGTGDVAPAINALSEMAAETFFVLGNHDEVDGADLYEDIEVLDGDVVRGRSNVIGGVSGIIGNPRKHQRKSEEDFLNSLDRCLQPETEIVILHQGPTAPGARGWPAINTTLERVRGRLVVFGHAHWEQPLATVDGNVFCNVDARVVVFVPRSGG